MKTAEGGSQRLIRRRPRSRARPPALDGGDMLPGGRGRKRTTHARPAMRPPVQDLALAAASALVALSVLSLPASAFAPILPPPGPCPARPSASAAVASSTALHGIKGFRAWFERTFPTAVVPVPRPRFDSKGKQGLHSETFDHVLVDVNPVMHVAMRRSKSPSHALVLMVKELDKLLDMARPTRSVVLAIDGPPSAAKLATQRKRRYGILQRGELHKRTLDFLLKRGVIGPDNPELRGLTPEEFGKIGLQVSGPDGWTSVETLGGEEGGNGTGTGPSRGKHSGKRSRVQRTKMERFAQEASTLAITPGTHFLERAENALIYWAWQRLSQRKGALAGVRIYLSPSIAPGEGEVKLLDWLRASGSPESNVVLPGHSVAILGGDSDLVLEGLIIPPSITHNVFVLLPDDGRRSDGTRNQAFCVSLWETTRSLARFLPGMTEEDLVQVRTDLVLLLIMNGNDYLPKLRGSSGFDKLFGSYLRLLRNWLDDGKGSAGAKRSRPFLVDPDTLEFNLPFCLAFFHKLAVTEPHLVTADVMVDWKRYSVTPLSQLNNLVEAKFLPGPITFSSEEVQDKSAEKEDFELFVLTLGNPPLNGREKIPDDSEETAPSHYRFETLRKKTSPTQKAKQLLAGMALEELLGSDYMDMPDYVVGNDVSQGDDDGDIVMNGANGDESKGQEAKIGPSSNIGYDWEADAPAEASVSLYLEGLLWNLQTYQDGVCTNYAYNYGRHMSPTASEIEAFLQKAMDKGRTVGPLDLVARRPFVEALPAGMSCLAALPSQVDYLVPAPYNILAEDGAVEDIYASCMEAETNVFDIAMFRRACEDALENVKPTEKGAQSTGELNHAISPKSVGRGRPIRTGENFWTVLHMVRDQLDNPFAPPEPFSDRLSKLRPHRRIVARRVMKTENPTRFVRGKKGSKSRRVKVGRVHGSLTHRRVVQEKKRAEGNASASVKDEISHNDSMLPLLLDAKEKRRTLKSVGYKQPYALALQQEEARVGKKKKGKIEASVKKSQDQKRRQRLPNDAVGKKKRKKVTQTGSPTSISKIPVTNKDGQTASSLLFQLQDIKALNIRWDTISQKDKHEEGRETIRLTLGRGTGAFCRLDGERIYQQERYGNVASRKAVRHHLAAAALADFCGDGIDWKESTFKDLKEHLGETSSSGAGK